MADRTIRRVGTILVILAGSFAYFFDTLLSCFAIFIGAAAENTPLFLVKGFADIGSLAVSVLGTGWGSCYTFTRDTGWFFGIFTIRVFFAGREGFADAVLTERTVCFFAVFVGETLNTFAFVAEGLAEGTVIVGLAGGNGDTFSLLTQRFFWLGTVSIGHTRA